MKKIIVFLNLFFCLQSVFATDDSSFDMQSMPLANIVGLYFKEVSKQPYVLCDALLNDKKIVSIRAAGKSLDTAILKSVIEQNGYEMKSLGGVTSVCSKQEVKKDKSGISGKPFVYRPLHQDVGYLVDLLSPLVDGHFANRRAAVGSLKVGGGDEGNALSTASKSSVGDEFLIFSGDEQAIERLKVLLSSIDMPSASVTVRAVLYEVSKNKNDASALKLLSNMFSGKLGVSINGDVLANTLSFSTPSFDFVASAISEDGRFKVVTSPYARVRNNQRVRLQVGADVPVAGQILLNPNGQTTQSTEYRSSGVILDVTARVRAGSIDLDLVQTVSNFVQTKTGNANPTLNKREIQTNLSVQPGEVVVLGGLTDSKTELANRGLFGWNFSKSDSESDSELVLILQVEKV